MSKVKKTANKSAAIRDFKAANPTASPKEISEAMKKTGLVASPQFVSTVLSNAKKKGGKIGKRGPKPKTGTPFGMRKIADVLKAVRLAVEFRAACETINVSPAEMVDAAEVL